MSASIHPMPSRPAAEVIPFPAEVQSLSFSEIYQDQLWCNQCCGKKLFIPEYEFEAGRVGWCFGCGERRVMWFERTSVEAE